MSKIFKLEIDCPELLEIDVYEIKDDGPRYVVMLGGVPAPHEFVEKYRTILDRMVMDHAITEGYI